MTPTYVKRLQLARHDIKLARRKPSPSFLPAGGALEPQVPKRRGVEYARSGEDNEQTPSQSTSFRRSRRAMVDLD
ncbi:hypothetical protein C8034_v005793 [Colletotrichum sidae]|uniref:Uncharacterized protein n=1 Tax=Colletotrichum sidae TaxID=1347389 RepID=A0A4R8T5T3_9PEZI|nr:hypothetical protein C8034_v005793 [Colletotrichum sidae]